MFLLTYNINNDYRDLELKAEAIWKLIQENDVEVAGLQEVTPDQFDQLIKQMPPGYRISDKCCQSFFMVLIWRGEEGICEYHPFVNSLMSRGFLVLQLSSGVFITTHLESGPKNYELRQKQCGEILDSLVVRPTIIFGDMNFCDQNERFADLLYLKTHRSDLFTYDSHHNKNATPPYRSDLDRFYTRDEDIADWHTEILADSRFSDHFPVLIQLYFE